jgi:nucleoside-diphosphate kinase
MPERTLIIIKPDGVQRRLTGRIIARFEQKGFKLIAAKVIQITEDLARKHYAVHKGKPFFEGVVKYLASSPVLVTVWQGEGVIETTRKMIGATFGYQAEPGTIRGDFSCSRGYNLVHGADSPASAEYEIALYFKPEEILNYEFVDEKWLYGRND